MKRSKKILIAAATVAITQCVFSAQSNAATFTWDGGGGDDNLTTGANWNPDGTPAAADSVTFTGAVRNNPIVDAAVQYANITFAGSSSFTIGTVGTTNAITVGASPTTVGVIRNTSTVSQAFSGPVNLVGGSVFADLGSLTFNGLFNIGNGGGATANNVTFSGNNTTTLAGGITGAGTGASAGATLTKSGNGTLVLTGASTPWQGRVTVNGGILRISNSDALGSGGGSLTVVGTSGSTGQGTLELLGNITLTKTVITGSRQAPTQNNVHIRNVSGNNTISTIFGATGGIQMNYESAGGNLTINNWNTTVSTGARTLRLSGAGNGEIVNWTSASNNVVTVIKDDAGTWSLRSTMNPGLSGAVFGPVTVNNGTLAVDGGLGERVTGSVVVNNGGTLQVGASGGTVGEVGAGVTPTSVTIKSGGALNASTFTDYSLQPAQTLIAGGSISTGGQLSVFGDNRVHIGDVSTASAGTMSVTGNLSLSNQFAATGGGLYFDLSNSTSGTNDKVNVSGNVSVSNGPVNLYVNALGGGFATGTYNLISYTGAALNTSDFNLSVTGGGTTRQTLGLSTVANSVDLVVSGAPGNLVWKGNLSGDWDIVGTSNWLNTGTSLADKFYQFDNVTFDDTATISNVNVTTSVTPGSMTVTTGGNYTFGGSGTITSAAALTKNGTGTLVVTNTGPNSFPSANINAGTLVLGTGGADGWVTNGDIANNGALVVNKSSTDTYNGIISGSGSVIKDGTGTLILTNNNTYSGSTTISAGTLQVGNGGTTGWFGTGSATTNGTLAINRSDNITYAGVIAGTGGLTKLAANTLELTGVNTYSGPTVVNGGVLQANEGAGLPVASNLTLNGGTLRTSATSFTRTLGTGSGEVQLTGGFSGFSTLGGPMTVTINNGGSPLPWGSATFNPLQLLLNDTTATSNIAFTSDIDLGGAAREIKVDALTGTVSGVVSNGTVRVNGLGTLVLSNVNTYASTVIDDGNAGPATVRATSSGALGTGSVALGSLGNATTARLEVTGGITLVNAITLFGRNNDSVAIQNLSGTNTLSGLITLAAGGNREWVQSDSGTLILSGTDGGGVAVTSASNMPDNSGRIITFKGAADGVVSGKIQNGLDLSSNPTFIVGVTKDGAGTWLLSGANTYTGPTTVLAGTLNIAQSSRTSASLNVADGAKAAMTARSGVPDLASSRKTLQVGTLNLNTSGTLDLADNDLVVDSGSFATIQAAVLAGFGTPGPGITSSTSDGSQILALFDNSLVGAGDWNGGAIGANAVVGKYTYFGDANIDGQVTGDDYGVIDANLDTTPPVGLAWLSGDTNLDGSVTGDDYGVIDANLGLGTSNPLSPSSLSAVPEPASLGLAAAGAILLGRRRRRQS